LVDLEAYIFAVDYLGAYNLVDFDNLIDLVAYKLEFAEQMGAFTIFKKMFF
jgi:hypothetical protein